MKFLLVLLLLSLSLPSSRRGEDKAPLPQSLSVSVRRGFISFRMLMKKMMSVCLFCFCCCCSLCSRPPSPPPPPPLCPSPLFPARSPLAPFAPRARAVSVCATRAALHHQHPSLLLLLPPPPLPLPPASSLLSADVREAEGTQPSHWLPFTTHAQHEKGEEQQQEEE